MNSSQVGDFSTSASATDFPPKMLTNNGSKLSFLRLSICYRLLLRAWCLFGSQHSFQTSKRFFADVVLGPFNINLCLACGNSDPGEEGYQ